jgi:16S rRNA (uracil1498-N3)-methyltransferase
MAVFFVPPRCLTPPTVSITGSLLTHLRDSLRVAVGQTILLSDGENLRYRAEVTGITKQALTGRLIETIARPPQQTPSLVLGQALLKGERMDWVIQKTTELGVQSIIPVQSQRSVVRLQPDRVEAQTARWQRIALEAAQQSEQWQVPTIASPCSLSTAKGRFSEQALTLILVERRDGIDTLGSIALPCSPTASILVLVGPEGGWTEEEIAAAQEAGCLPITLGRNILRAETAATVAVGILQHRLGELG